MMISTQLHGKMMEIINYNRYKQTMLYNLDNYRTRMRKCAINQIDLCHHERTCDPVALSALGTFSLDKLGVGINNLICDAACILMKLELNIALLSQKEGRRN